MVADTRTHHRILCDISVLGDRAAELKQRRRALQYVTVSPNRVGGIAQAILVLNNAWR
jgi:hypothetical protein